ncbi:O-antigen ligase family protein [Rahnella sikkimica]|uniref:O-antigen ligase family protein n=1 Tax=Rahnella sikkimica TaxID=1805933 RepID=UPI001865963B|nr:O-antigen ligase family protein [Rahnella sikkimica]
MAIIIVTFISAFHFKGLGKYKENWLLAAAFLCVGLSQLFWVERFPGAIDSIYMADENYHRTSVYLLLGAVLTFFSVPFKIEGKRRVIIMLMAFLGFIYLGSRGLYYVLTNPEGRLRIDSAATTSAYLFVMQSFLTLYIVYAMNCRGKKLICALVVFITFLIILLTQTRSVLIIYPFLLLGFVIINKMYPLRSVMLFALFSVGLTAAISGLFLHNLQERMIGAYYEISGYETNNDTSFGSRVSMWKSGIYAIEQHPFGQSTSTRFNEVKSYMDNNERGNPEGVRNSIYHLHNDVIESSSLQGILGGVALLFLFSSLIVFFYKKNLLKIALPFLILPVILFGMVDTLFINDRFIVMFCMQVYLFSAIQNCAREDVPSEPFGKQMTDL